MNFWFRIGMIFLIIFFSLALILLLQVQKISPTGRFIARATSFLGILLGLVLLFLATSTLVTEAKRKTEKITEEYVENDLIKKIANTELKYLEGSLLFFAGMWASYAKKRGTSTGALTSSGVYKSYEKIFHGIQKAVKWVMKYHPELRSYVLPILEKIPVVYADKVLESLASAAEIYNKYKRKWIDKEGLKILAYKLEKYARK
jgi:hypothetical protein